MQLANKRVVVVGLGLTGIALAKFAAARGASVVVTDNRPATKLVDAMAQLDGLAIRFELGGHVQASFTEADLVVLSPGVPELPEIIAARAANVPVWAEIELAFRYLHPGATLIAITGTNGKSTTTALTGALCAASGRPTFCGGNLGNMPMIDVIDHPANCDGGLIVVEVAAFMLEHCETFAPHIGILTNITEDHLDRFGTIERYAVVKGHIWSYQRATDLAIANASDEWTMRCTSNIKSQLFTFDARTTASAQLGARVSSDRQTIELRLSNDAEPELYPVDDLVIVGNHNLENAMGAYLAARLAGVAADAVRAGAQRYRPLPHRMERVGILPVDGGDVHFYDDSKGTNVASVAASVRGFPRPLVLVAGGVDKGGSYASMFAALDDACKGLVLIGAAAEVIRQAAKDHGVTYPVLDASDMHEAVRIATKLCVAGDAVVLSPACSSYDMFQHFGHRGMVFREAVSAVGATRLDGGGDDPTTLAY